SSRAERAALSSPRSKKSCRTCSSRKTDRVPERRPRWMRPSTTKRGVCESWPEKPVFSKTESSGALEKTSVTDHPYLRGQPAPVRVASLPFPALGGERREQYGLELGGEIVDRVGNDPDGPPFQGFRRDTIHEIHRGHDSARVFGGTHPRHEVSSSVENRGVDLCPARNSLHVLIPIDESRDSKQTLIC